MNFVQINTKNQLDRIINVNDIIEMHIEQDYDKNYRIIDGSFSYVIIIRNLGIQKVSEEHYFYIRNKLNILKWGEQ